jgi:hypothetical protein
VRKCFKCDSPNYIAKDCLLNQDSDDDKKKNKKKDKKEKKDKPKFIFKKKGNSYVATWDSDYSSKGEDGNDDESNNGKMKAMASLAINNKPSLFDSSPSCFMAKANRYKRMMIVIVNLTNLVIVMMMMKDQLKGNSWTC